MNDKQRPPLADPQPMGRDLSRLVQEEDHGGLAPMGSGSMSIATTGMALTMQPCPVKRSLPAIYRELGELCRINGNDYYYSWEVRNRREGTIDTIEGPTIKLANDLARTYGNCWYGVIDVVETATHWFFRALFIDLEKGVNVSRPFRQRKSQDTGMRDRDRQEDIVFQIAASKAIRNVVCNALGTFADYMLDESKKNLSEWVEKNRDKALTFIGERIQRYGLTELRVNALVGRAQKEWTNRDIAKVMLRFKAIEDGSARVDDVFPTEEDAAVVTAEKQEAAKKETKAKESAPAASAQPAADATAGATAPSPGAGQASDQPSKSAAPQPSATAKRGRGRPRKDEVEELPSHQPDRDPEPPPAESKPPAAADPDEFKFDT